MRVHFALTASLLALLGAISPGTAVGANSPKAFHVAGIPNAKRGERLDIKYATDRLIITHAGKSLDVAYAQIRLVRVLYSVRDYETTAAAAAATGPFLILTKHKVDTIVVDYESERHAQMGLVFQVGSGMGLDLGNLLRSHGVQVVVDPPRADLSGKDKRTSSKPGEP